jgi:Family of unknown function (DUF6515)
MNTITPAKSAAGIVKPVCAVAIGSLALIITTSVLRAGGGDDRRAGGGAPAPRPTVVDRSTHGSVRHVDTYTVQRPVIAPRPVVPIRPVNAPHPVEVHPVVAPHHNVIVHRDVEADIHAHHFWDDFAFGRRFGGLPVGFINLQVGGAPYYYDDGIYYQPYSGGGYQEVYPPVGAELSDLPDGAIEVEGPGGETYYFAGGAFYAQQADGSYAIVPPPIGIVVPELPPGATQISINGNIAYQFNGVDYEPVFVDGVTQYQTFAP